MPFAALHRLVGRVHKVVGPAPRNEELASGLRRSKTPDGRVRPLVDEIDAVFWEADPETFHFLFVSRRAEQMLGYPPAQWRGDPSFWFSLIHPEDRERVAARCRAAVKREEDCELVYRAVAADRRVVSVRNIVHVLRDAAGRATLLRGVMLDVSGLRAEQRRADRAHRIAETLQHAFLPASLPEIPGVRVHAAYMPGTVESEIGGDWYDVFRLPDGRVAISVGDVVGHGLQAAVIMGQVRQSIRAAALDGHSPSMVLIRASSVLRLTYEIEGMATAIYGVFDPVGCAFTYATAGHPAPVLATPDGDIEVLAAGGLPLGAQTLRPQGDTTLALAPGSLLLLYTDGLVESTKDVLAGERALMAAVRAEWQASSADPARAILERMLGGRRPLDDIAMLALAIDAAPVEGFHLTVPAEPSSLPRVRQALRQLIRALGVGDDRGMALQVAVGEALNNAIEHAYGTTSGTVHVRAAHDGKVVVVEVADNGRWRPPRTEGRGHGLTLMRGLVDEVEIDSRPSGTIVRLSIAFSAQPQP
jgi:PAS domain S-box-containing protein